MEQTLGHSESYQTSAPTVIPSVTVALITPFREECRAELNLQLPKQAQPSEKVSNTVS